MANEKAMWQALLQMAERKGLEFTRMAAGLGAQIRDGRVRFDVSRTATEMRSELPTTRDMDVLRGQVGSQGSIRKKLVDLVTPVVAAAPQSHVTTDVVGMSVQAGKDLDRAANLIGQAEGKKRTALAMVAQIEDETEQAAQLMIRAEKALASANAMTVQIEVRIRRAVSDIDGV
jgi:hypothetical protein